MSTLSDSCASQNFSRRRRRRRSLASPSKPLLDSAGDSLAEALSVSPKAWLSRASSLLRVHEVTLTSPDVSAFRTAEGAPVNEEQRALASLDHRTLPKLTALSPVEGRKGGRPVQKGKGTGSSW